MSLRAPEIALNNQKLFTKPNLVEYILKHLCHTDCILKDNAIE
jgi:hypothetical protein